MRENTDKNKTEYGHFLRSVEKWSNNLKILRCSQHKTVLSMFDHFPTLCIRRVKDQLSNHIETSQPFCSPSPCLIYFDMIKTLVIYGLTINWNILGLNRCSCLQMFFQIGVLKDFANFHRKTPVLESFFNKGYCAEVVITRCS